MDWLDSVKRIKKDKNLTNEQLSEISGISLGTLNKLLSGATTDPKLSTLLALSRAFDCSLDELLGRGDGLSRVAESEIMRKYAELDGSGKETADYIINKEYKRMRSAAMGAAIRREEVRAIRTLRLYDTGASAGTGSYLTDSGYTNITVYRNAVTDSADFAVRVAGNSMNPKYQDGDILLVSSGETPQKGEFGIFSVDGESYFKQYGGDELVSLNPDYDNIPLSGVSSFICFGKVIGRIKRS